MAIHPTQRGYFITLEQTIHGKTTKHNIITMRHPSEWLVWYTNTYGNFVVLVFWNALSMEHYNKLRGTLEEH